MATIAEFTIPADAFPLGRIFDRLPDATIELERVIPTSESLLPYFWVTDGDTDHIRTVLSDNVAIETVTIIDEIGNTGLFRAEWNPDVEGVLTAIIESELTMLSAFGTASEWVFEFRAEDTDQITVFQQYCTDHGITPTLTRLTSLADLQVGDEYNLTENQHEALLLAFNDGYYDDDRDTDLETLADQLGISRPAFADRLRRGTRNLLGSTIVQHQQDEADGDGH